jgi:hypothetical protein
MPEIKELGVKRIRAGEKEKSRAKRKVNKSSTSIDSWKKNDAVSKSLPPPIIINSHTCMLVLLNYF